MNSNSDAILSTISTLFNNMFSSIDSSIYSALDEISFIDTDIINSTYLEKILGTSSSSGILLLANALLIGFVLYFAVQYLLSSFSIVRLQQNPYQFFIKIVFIGICMNCSFFICEQIINLNALISSTIREIGSDFLDTDICFTNLIDVLNSIISTEENATVFSVDGIIKTIVSVGFLNLIFIYSIRYILIKVFVLISPFSLLFVAFPSTINFFKSWFKCFISLLFTEIFSSLILIVMFSIEYSPTDVVSKLLFVGSVFALMKVNSYIKEFIGGISLDAVNSLYYLRGFMR